MYFHKGNIGFPKEIVVGEGKAVFSFETSLGQIYKTAVAAKGNASIPGGFRESENRKSVFFVEGGTED